MKNKSAVVILLAFALLAAAWSVSAQVAVDPLPGTVTYVRAPDCPVNVNVIGVENAPTGKRTVYVLENHSKNVVWGMVLLGLPGTPGPTVLANVGLTGGSKMHEGSRLVRFDGTQGQWEVSIDLVLFRDGTAWGPAKNADSAYLLGIQQGMRKRSAMIRDLVKAADDKPLAASVITPAPNTEILPPAGRQRDGFVFGYTWASREFRVNFDDHGDTSGIEARLVEMEQMLGMPTSANTKYVVKRYYTNEPLKIVGVRFRGQNVDVDEGFTGSGDWVGDVEVLLRNDSGRVIRHVSLNVEFPETSEKGDMLVSPMSWGKNPLNYIPPGTDKPIPPDTTVSLTWNGRYEVAKRLVGTAMPIDTVSRIRLALGLVIFDDGTGWLQGRAVKQDRDNPMRWDPVK